MLWTVANELLLQPREYTAFSLALDRLRDDPRVMVALGSPVSGYGQETRNRAARQRIPHRVYTDDRGVEHVQARSPPAAARCIHVVFRPACAAPPNTLQVVACMERWEACSSW